MTKSTDKMEQTHMFKKRDLRRRLQVVVQTIDLSNSGTQFQTDNPLMRYALPNLGFVLVNIDNKI